jgi:hypothetical protein
MYTHDQADGNPSTDIPMSSYAHTQYILLKERSKTILAVRCKRLLLGNVYTAKSQKLEFPCNGSILAVRSVKPGIEKWHELGFDCDSRSSVRKNGLWLEGK